MENIIFALLFFLPAGISNMTPVFSNKIPGLRDWKTPIDFGKNYRGQRMLGPNKTWRGLVSGVLMGTLVGFILSQTYFSDYDTVLFVLVAASMSLGALVGDAVESFFKRQRGIKSGQPWFPFDQTDYIIGGLVFTLPFTVLPVWVVVWICVLYFGLHLLSSYIGYRLGLKALPI
jgi:CDP-2,3-bis-(O-geranylgeranyl)-sn-glycerol synthase